MLKVLEIFLLVIGGFVWRWQMIFEATSGFGELEDRENHIFLSGRLFEQSRLGRGHPTQIDYEKQTRINLATTLSCFLARGRPYPASPLTLGTLTST
ncbi:MAG: hypothetical protein C4293_03310 [Nitrospiraceae bacterium]